MNYHRQVIAVRNLGGAVWYDYELDPNVQPSGPPWLRSALGDRFFAAVVWASFFQTEATDADLNRIKDWIHLQSLDLTGTEVTDAGMPVLAIWRASSIVAAQR